MCVFQSTLSSQQKECLHQKYGNLANYINIAKM